MFSQSCAFCNLRFKFRFLDAPLGIKSELIIVSSFLHLTPKTSANKPAKVTPWPVESYQGRAQTIWCSAGVCSLRRNKGRARAARVRSCWAHLTSSCLIHTFQGWIKSHQENFCPNDKGGGFFFLFSSFFPQEQVGGRGWNAAGRPGCLQADQVPTHS